MTTEEFAMPVPVSMRDAVASGSVPPCGMGTQVQGRTFRNVSVMRYDKRKDKPTMWWVEDFIDNGRTHEVYLCGSLDEAQEVYARLTALPSSQ